MADRGGEGEDLLGYSGADAGDGAACRSKWPLKGQLMDSMTWRRNLKNRVSVGGFSPLRAGHSNSLPP